MSASSAPENQVVRSDEISNKEREAKITRSLARLRAQRDEDIDFSDIPETTPEQWVTAQPNRFYRPVKDQVTLRIDRPVLEWFKANHEKYQTAINQVLLEHMKEQRRAEMRCRAAEEAARENEVNRGE